MRRPRPLPDNRPDWRDPSLPPSDRDYTFRMSDGTTQQITEVTPEQETQIRAMMMQGSPAPNWRDDPTYNLRRRRDGP